MVLSQDRSYLIEGLKALSDESPASWRAMSQGRSYLTEGPRSLLDEALPHGGSCLKRGPSSWSIIASPADEGPASSKARCQEGPYLSEDPRAPS
jgi:hypothetical protein